MDLTVTDDLYEAKYEAHLNGELAGTLEYELTSDLIILIHTEVLPGHQDQGIGGQLARFALDDARRRGLRVRPVCTFIRSWLERHNEYADIVH
ncbi:MAG TPA: GNAT family N-acetyltransferase [Propionibacteriaceae bacterium]|jgi:predicted GNAT family acetyltransferase|nr:GNAT family N-acetyltransferase [Propionibacteriaceae bacterium]